MKIRKITKRDNGQQVIRLPTGTFTTSYISMEETEEGILLKPVGEDTDG